VMVERIEVPGPICCAGMRSGKLVRNVNVYFCLGETLTLVLKMVQQRCYIIAVACNANT